MFYCLLHEANGKRLYFASNEPANKDEYVDTIFITKEKLESIRPKNLNEKIDMIMLNLGTKIKFWGDGYVFSPYGGNQVDAQNHMIISGLLLVVDVKNSNGGLKERLGTLKFIVDYGYLEHKGSSNEYSFTVEGWKYLGELQSSKHELPQAFIAMHFLPKMNKARESIRRAIIDSGYDERIIDEKEHNNQIVPEIFYEIQRSKFLVADLTGHRNGVYYEAGYAQGLGKEVILTCKDEDFKNRHFDVAQISTIVWKDEDDLYERLTKRIEATVGKRIR